MCALTEAATADVQAVLVDETVTVATHTAAGRTLALVVGMAVIESGVTHVCKGCFEKKKSNKKHKKYKNKKKNETTKKKKQEDNKIKNRTSKNQNSFCSCHKIFYSIQIINDVIL